MGDQFKSRQQIPETTKPSIESESSAEGRLVCDSILDDIILELENGVVPWRRPWGVHYNVVTETRCQWFNSFWLTLVSEHLGVTHPGWLTPRQLAAHGGRPKPGAMPAFGLHWFTSYTKVPVERASQVGAARGRPDRGSAEEHGADGHNKAPKETRVVYSRSPAIKLFQVYNMEQVEGLPLRFLNRLDEAPSDDSRAAGLIKGSGASVAHGGTRAFYSLETDAITMPPNMLLAGCRCFVSTQERSFKLGCAPTPPSGILRPWHPGGLGKVRGGRRNARSHAKQLSLAAARRGSDKS